VIFCLVNNQKSNLPSIGDSAPSLPPKLCKNGWLGGENWDGCGPIGKPKRCGRGGSGSLPRKGGRGRGGRPPVSLAKRAAVALWLDWSENATGRGNILQWVKCHINNKCACPKKG
jgi:hypothetical protein